MPDIKISISTEAELQAAKATEAQLERSIAKAKLLGKNYDEIAGQLVKVRDRVSQLSQADQELGKKSEEAAKGKWKLLDSLKAIGQQSPIIGAAIEAIKSPIAATVLVAAAAIAKFREFSQAIDDMAVAFQVLDGFNAKIRTFQTILAGQRNRKNDLAQSLDEIRNSAKPAADALRDANEQIALKLRLEGNEDAAQKALELAKVDSGEANKKLTPEAAIKARSNIEQRFNARARDREVRGAAGIVTAIGNARRAAEEKLAADQGAIPGAEEEAARAYRALAMEKANLSDMSEAGLIVNGERFSIKDALKRRNELKDFVVAGGSFHQDPVKEFMRRKAEKDLALFETGIQGFRVATDNQESNILTAQGRYDRASGRVSRLSAAVQSGAEQVRQFGERFSVTSGALNAENESGGRVLQINDQELRERAGAQLGRATAKEQKKEHQGGELIKVLMDIHATDGQRHNAEMSLLQLIADQKKKQAEELRQMKGRQMRDPQ